MRRFVMQLRKFGHARMAGAKKEPERTIVSDHLQPYCIRS